MKKAVFYLFVLCCVHGFSQTTLTGKVLDTDDNPLIGAAVYLNNTSVGTTTDDKGEFELPIKNGVYSLIVSYLGYETIQYPINTDEVNKRLVFKLVQKVNVLDEVVISKRKKISDEDRAYFLVQFKRNFLGQTNLAKKCVILNEDVIDFDWDLATRTLEVSLSEPLKIRNDGLGYMITYDLVYFQQTPQRVSYLGYTRYENLKGSKRKLRKWGEKRTVAYNGSSMHFLRSIINNNLKEEGFIVDRYREVPNPERPHDSIIEKARKSLRNLQGPNGGISFSISAKQDLNVQSNVNAVIEKAKKDINTKISDKQLDRIKNAPLQVTKDKNGVYTAKTKYEYNQKRDSLLRIINKARLKRFIIEDIKTDVSREEYSFVKDKFHYLKFKDFLRVKYMKESEEDNFRPGPAKLEHQESMINLFVESTPFDEIGVLVRPLEMLMNGYWSYEK